MFKVVTSGPEHTLSFFFETFESSRRGLLMRMRRMNTEFGKQSLISRGPVVWYGLNKNTRNLLNKDLLNSALKKI